MRQLIQMFLFDLRTSMKSFMGAYIVIVPIAILIILQSFLPSVESTSANIAVVSSGPNAVEKEIIKALDSFADVTTYDTIKDMERKLRGVGSSEGLYWDPLKKQYVSVLERNRKNNAAFSIAARVVRQYYYRKNNPNTAAISHFTYGVPPELSGRTKTSPVATMGGSIFIILMLIISGFIIGLNIVNDKEEGTDNAIKVSPVSKSDYFIGKSIYPLLVTLFYTIIALLVLKLIHVNILQTYTVVLVSFSISLVFGLIQGAIAKNENEAIGFGKMLSMVVLLSILGGTLLPDKWQWAVWWSPLYWAYDILDEIFTETATWRGVVWESAVTAGLTGIYFLLLRKKIVKGLS
ncbi:MAG: ABC transporter permease [Spirochaetales bacterium]|nr:ABC transporter permease [Spirochaetales bacterium]